MSVGLHALGRAIARLSAACLAVGCAASHSVPAAAPPPDGSSGPAPGAEVDYQPRAPLPGCPPIGSRLGVEELDAGAAMVFTASDEFEELRNRAAATALTGAPPNEMRLDNIFRGVRVVFEAASPEAVPELQRRVKSQVERTIERCGITPAPPEEASPDAAPPTDHSKKKPVHAPSAKPGAVKPPGKAPAAKPAPKPVGKPKAKPAGKPKPKPAPPTPPKAKPPTTPPGPPPPNPPPKIPVLPGAPPTPLGGRAFT